MITDTKTTLAQVTDVEMTEPAAALDARGLPTEEHAKDSGYAREELLLAVCARGIKLLTTLLKDK